MGSRSIPYDPDDFITALHNVGFLDLADARFVTASRYFLDQRSIFRSMHNISGDSSIREAVVLIPRRCGWRSSAG